MGTFIKLFRANRCVHSIILQLPILFVSAPYESIGATRLSNMSIKALGSCLGCLVKLKKSKNPIKTRISQTPPTHPLFFF